MKYIQILIVLLLSILFLTSCNESNNNVDACRVVDAAYNGDIALLKHELGRGCDPRGDTDHVNEPIYAGIALGNISVVKTLLDAGIDPAFDWGEAGGDLLTNAVQFGHEEIVKLLVERGANINKQIGHSALFISIVHDHSDIETFLRLNGSELNEHDKKFFRKHPYLQEILEP